MTRLNYWTPANFTLNTLKFKLRGSTIVRVLQMMQMEKQTVYTLVRLLLNEQLFCFNFNRLIKAMQASMIPRHEKLY